MEELRALSAMLAECVGATYEMRGPTFHETLHLTAQRTRGVWDWYAAEVDDRDRLGPRASRVAVKDEDALVN